MNRKAAGGRGGASFLVLGVGAFAQSLGQTLKDAGATVCTYLTRNYGHYPPAAVGRTYSHLAMPSPVPLLKAQGIDCVIPQSIDWAQASWAEALLRSGVPVFGPTGPAMRIERERDFARRICAEFKIPFPQSHVASNRLEAERLLAEHPRPFVIKNPLCSPTSPIHTILCETVADTRSWLRQVNYAEGVFLQEYLGRAEAGHIVLVSGGEIHSLVTNQEYKRAFSGNLGIVAGAPLGGLVEKDPEDKYGLARQLIHPLRSWLRRVKYHGPLQVTAVRRGGRWHVIEYNIRIGVTSGPMLLRLLKDPAGVLLRTARDQRIDPQFEGEARFGCSLTLAGYGYPYVQVRGPRLPLEVAGRFNCDVWWNEVEADPEGGLVATGHRIADVVALAPTLEGAIARAYANIAKIRVVGSYYRTDVGASLWPPGRS
jgi:phosphoribosylamine--glycine ligase